MLTTFVTTLIVAIALGFTVWSVMAAVREQNAHNISCSASLGKDTLVARFPKPRSFGVPIQPTIFKTGPYSVDSLPEELVRLFRATERNNAPYRIEYYSDDRCETFVSENYPENSKAYKTVTATAFKADIFRYCVLHKYGGVYSDLTQEFKAPISSLVDPLDELVLVRDWNALSKNCLFDGVEISFIAAAPRAQVFDDALRRARENIAKRAYASDVLDITGAKLFRRALEATKPNYRLELQRRSDGTITFITSGLLAIVKLANHDALLKRPPESSHVALYRSRKLYQ